MVVHPSASSKAIKQGVWQKLLIADETKLKEMFVVQLTTANGLFGLGLPELALVGGAAVLLFGEQNYS